MTKQIEFLLEQVLRNGYFICLCGNKVEADGQCPCEAENPLLEQGLV